MKRKKIVVIRKRDNKTERFNRLVKKSDIDKFLAKSAV